ncbi:MAG: DUF3667 domain-containing protein, partial [Bacteroidetes bacterium]|nr:DUF3667 domain-containing protein [Bacteroidota bacterium]
CLNCGNRLSSKHNYCPVCGQENTNKRVSFGLLLKDFIKDNFELDSRLAESIVPFLFKPGFLTKAYSEGKRVEYIAPVRLYLIISILYFFLLTFESKKAAFNEDEPIYSQQTVYDDDKSRKITGWAISIGDEDKGDTTKQDTIYAAPEDRSEIESSGTLTLSTSDKINIDFKLGDLENMVNDEDFDPGFFLDTLGIERNFYTLLLANKAVKLIRQKGEGFMNDLVENISIMMFFLLPLFALLLKIIYIRRSKFYIEHLIFSLHLHSFTFLMLFLSLLAYIIFSKSFLFYVLLILFVYALLAFKKVYEQRWFKTVLKMFLLFLGYSFTMLIFLVATMLVTFLLF